MHAIPKGQTLSHGERWQRDGIDAGLPELDPEEYIVDLLFEMGPVRQTGEAILPTDWPVIAPFGEALGLDSDDMMLLSRMCRGYCDAWREGENPLAIAPVDRGKRT